MAGGGPQKDGKAPQTGKGMVSGGMQQEGQAGAEQMTVTGEVQLPSEAPTGQEEEAEKGKKEAEEWTVVKNRKRKTHPVTKTSQKKGKRHLQVEDTDSSSESEDGRKEGRHQKKRQSAARRKESSNCQPRDDPPEEMGNHHPPPGESQEGPTATQLQVTGSSDPLTAPLSDIETDSVDPNGPSEELDSYLSPARVQQFAYCTGMQTATPEGQDQRQSDMGNLTTC
ncbi:uncharacterized protein LOC122552046 [Chiloscyllium plagiosum]|uniref:uncharacterized protein LOC122552046 n=1 Tax=Chiloscyllium plagiosum TaxID=36176 RepID=UPI001CB7AF17|nr:uncharacterized protein LOC122552046 [Chiloscyllium plagiosum]